MRANPIWEVIRRDETNDCVGLFRCCSSEAVLLSSLSNIRRNRPYFTPTKCGEDAHVGLPAPPHVRDVVDS